MLSRRSFVIAAATALSAGGVSHAQVRRDTVTFPSEPPAEGPAGASSANASPADDAPAEEAPPNSNIKWRTPNGAPRAAAPMNTLPATAAPPTSAQPPLQAVPASTPHAPIARVTRGGNTLPNDAGQEWRDYDITPYTARVTSTNRPEQAIMDWILRETGYEAWHTQPLAILSIDSRKLSVYHTPAMHAVVQDIVDRFVNSEAESQVFNMRVITLRSPDWRAKHHKLLHPVSTQTQGIQAWLLAREDSAMMVNDLRRRSDFQEHSTPHLMVNNGQSKQISAVQVRNYLRDVALKPGQAFPGFEAQMAHFDEGFKLEFSPLLSVDGRVVDAVIRCDIDQLEKMVPVMIDVPTVASPRQRQKVEVPQPNSIRVHERFRWPTEQVLLLSLGVGPAPVPAAPGALNMSFWSDTTRADLLVFIESKGKVGTTAATAQPGQREASLYQNRYKPITPSPVR